MTTEEKLAAIIEAQVRGGYENWKMDPIDVRSRGYVWHAGQGHAERHFCNVLEILLDVDGLKACHGEALEGGLFLRAGEEVGTDSGKVMIVTPMPAYVRAGHQILDSWFAGGATAAIDTAFTLLSQP